MKSTDSPIIIEETFKTSKEILWNALTKKEEMIQWFFENIPFRDVTAMRHEVAERRN